MNDIEKAELLKTLPSLPHDFSEWVMELFDGWHITFYSRPDREILLECCHCGAISRWTTKKSDPILPPWGDRQTPQKGDETYCPYCEAQGRMMPKKNRKYSIDTDADVWIGQKMNDGGKGGYVLRFFRPILKAVPDEESSYEDLILNERMRIFFPVGMAQKSYKLYYHAYEENWTTAYGFNTMGFSYNSPSRGNVYPGTYGEMRGTVMQYSCTEEIMNTPGLNITIQEWQQAYIKDKWLEAFYKLGLDDLIDAKLFSWRFPRCNYRAKNPYDYLKIYKSRLQDLCDCPSGTMMNALAIFRAERKAKTKFGPEVMDLIKAGVSENDLAMFLQYMTVKKLINYLNKQKCNLFRNTDLNGTYLEYRDYLQMKEKVGCDMTDEITLFPRDLREAHAKAIIESDKEKADKRKAEVNARFKAVQMRFKGADKIYHYEKGAFIIRPAKDAGEIVEEGRILHHCVGGDGYLSSHAKKNSIICFMRLKKAPDIPFVTVEIKPDCTIEQWYGENDSKPEEKKIDRWLKSYMKSRDPKKIRSEAKRKIPAARAV